MNKKLIAIQALILSLAVTSISDTAANAASLNTAPSISVDADGVLTLTDGTWSGATAVSHQVWSCRTERPTVTTGNLAASPDCYRLYADNMGAQLANGDDLDNAYRSTGGDTYETYGPMSHGGYIVYTSTADSAWDSTSISVSASYTRDGLSTPPSLTISSSTVSGTNAVLTEPTQGSLKYFACDGAFTPATYSNSDRRVVIPIVSNSSNEISGTNTSSGGTIFSGGPTCKRFSVGGTSLNLDGASLANGSTYNPAQDGTHIVAATFIEFVSVGNGTAYYFLSDSATYSPPAPPTVANQPTLSLTGTAISFAGATFSGGSGSTGNRIYSCPSSVTAITSPVAFSSTGLASCQQLYAQADSSLPATDLATAYLFVVQGMTPSYVSYDSNSHGSHVVGVSTKSNLYVVTASVQAGSGGGSVQAATPTPYTGPVVQAPGALKPVAPGKKLALSGSNLTGVSKATINGFEAEVKVNSAGEIEIVIPASLASGTYDLVITSDSGVLTVQDAVTVSTTVKANPVAATKLKADAKVKVYVNDVIGAGKVQIFMNGKEVAWVNAKTSGDKKLVNDYLVRTLTLAEGKNIIEVYVDGVRTTRTAYTK